MKESTIPIRDRLDRMYEPAPPSQRLALLLIFRYLINHGVRTVHSDFTLLTFTFGAVPFAPDSSTIIDLPWKQTDHNKRQPIHPDALKDSSSPYHSFKRSSDTIPPTLSNWDHKPCRQLMYCPDKSYASSFVVKYPPGEQFEIG